MAQTLATDNLKVHSSIRTITALYLRLFDAWKKFQKDSPKWW